MICVMCHFDMTCIIHFQCSNTVKASLQSVYRVYKHYAIIQMKNKKNQSCGNHWNWYFMQWNELSFNSCKIKSNPKHQNIQLLKRTSVFHWTVVSRCTNQMAPELVPVHQSNVRLHLNWYQCTNQEVADNIWTGTWYCKECSHFASEEKKSHQVSMVILFS